jgi:hypothetical protein
MLLAVEKCYNSGASNSSIDLINFELLKRNTKPNKKLHNIISIISVISYSFILLPFSQSTPAALSADFHLLN